MPVKIPDNLPAFEVLAKENIFVMAENRATQQDIRPLQIAILNLMPNKIETETQILRLLSNTPLQIEITLFHTQSYESKHTASDHLQKFYTKFSEIKSKKYDGLIITGAPLGSVEFDEVEYWFELQQIMDWSKTNVYSTLHMCWGAVAGLYHHYGIPKRILPKKMFGVFSHYVTQPGLKLLRGFDDCFWVPHSRHSEPSSEELSKHPELEILAESSEAGAYIIAASNYRQVFVTGHSEYDRYTLRDEYLRDINKGLIISFPKNYFPDNNPEAEPLTTWRGHANLLFANWLNYCVYQETPFSIHEVK